MSRLHRTVQERLFDASCRMCLTALAIGVVMGFSDLFKLGRKSAPKKVSSPSAAGYAHTTLSAQGTHKFAEVLDANSAAGKPTRPARAAGRRIAAHA
jgi:hypothetical protein